MGYSKRNWTTREARLLVKYYPTYGADASRWPEPIDRSELSVRSYANKHGILREGIRYVTIGEQEEGELRKAWYDIARKMGKNPKLLVTDLCVMRRNGLI